jgi:hypothetical protein
MTPEDRTLLLKQHDEINAWGRAVNQIYFTGYTVFVSINGAALALAFSSNTTSLRNSLNLWHLICTVFASWSILVCGSGLAIMRYSYKAARDLDAIRDTLLEDSPDKTVVAARVSVMPVSVIKMAFPVGIIGLLALALIWGWLALSPPALQ